MTFNPLMLPALPPTAAGGLRAAGETVTAAFRSGRLSESSQDSRRFLDTLNRVALRQDRNPHRSTFAKIRSEVSAGSAQESPNDVKTGDSGNESPNLVVENGTAPLELSPIFGLSQAFGMIHMRLLDFSMAGNSSFLNETPSEIPGASGPFFPKELMDYVQPKAPGSLIEWLVGIGPFEQLQANISLESRNRYLVEQLAAELGINRDIGGMLGAQSEFIGFWPWQLSSPEFTINIPAASVRINGDGSLAALLQMQQTAVAASGLNADAVGTAGQNAPDYIETIQLNEALSSKMALPFLAEESDFSDKTKLAENAHMLGAAKEVPTSFWAKTDPNSPPFLETPSKPQAENSPFFKMTADIKAAAEQSANPNFVTEGALSKPADDGFSFKHPVFKAESLPIAEWGSKNAQSEGDVKDGGFMFAQEQMPEHLKTLESATRSLAGAQRGLTSQAMDQIVQKAILLLNNDQHEVRIELKPEFLGHIRMQIVTESQQVAIKIVAESAFVKDMLENNLHQLRTVLQAQGLDIEELEVSVAHDSHAEGDTHQAAEVAKVQAARNGTDFDDGSSDEPALSPSLGNSAMAETAIDYFA